MTTNNRGCDASISVSVIGIALCACFIIAIKIDLSGYTAQTPTLGVNKLLILIERNDRNFDGY